MNLLRFKDYGTGRPVEGGTRGVQHGQGPRESERLFFSLIDEDAILGVHLERNLRSAMLVNDNAPPDQGLESGRVWVVVNSFSWPGWYS